MELSIGYRLVLSNPIVSVSGATKLILLVNKRSVRDKLIVSAIRDGYGNFLKSGKYPSGVLSLWV